MLVWLPVSRRKSSSIDKLHAISASSYRTHEVAVLKRKASFRDGKYDAYRLRVRLKDLPVDAETFPKGDG